VTCEDCLIAERYGRSRLYNPACLACGGRYLRAIKAREDLPQTVRTQWLRKALADWCAHGHGEQELRELAAPKAKEKANADRN
jgi:hypothetical protein